MFQGGDGASKALWGSSILSLVANMSKESARIKSFVKTFLLAGYDKPVAIADFHEEIWALVTSGARRIAIAAPRAHAKAQSLDSKVFTPDGWASLGSISAGDVIIGGDGRPAKVTKVHPVSSMDLYRVTTRDGRSALCNLGHLWNVKNGGNTGNRESTKSLEEILQNWKADRFDKRYGKRYTEYRYKIPAPSPVEFRERQLPLDPYTLGAWLGDGHSAGGRFTTDDPEILGYFPYPTEKQSGKYGYVIREIYPKLKQLGVLNNKHIPSDYLFSSVEHRKALLQGLMDTDGTCHRDGNIAYFSNTNKKLIDGITHLIRSLGGIATENTNYTTCNGKRFLSWRVSCKLQKGMNPFRLKRKANRWRGSVNTDSYIVSIEKEKTGLGRCISVERETYITDDFLLTHNSTAITHALTLYMFLFRKRKYGIIVSDTESQASQFLGDIKMELLENESLRDLFGIKRLLKDAVTDIIVECSDGYRFRITALGAEQKVRGRLWRKQRPDYIVVDDLENDEVVENDDRRKKLNNWFFKALVPSLSKRGIIVVVGTILHMDSVLMRLMNNKSWKHKLYKAHESFSSFSNILWSAQWSEDELREKRQEFIDDGSPEGYSQEYLNDPIAHSEAFFKKEDFKELESEMRQLPLNYVASMDLAISDADKSAYTVITIGGLDEFRRLQIRQVIRDRFGGDANEIINTMFQVQTLYNIEFWKIERGQIERTLMGPLNERMQQTGIYLNIIPGVPTRDKRSRARAIQARMRAGGVYFDKEADWYPTFEQELLQFPKGMYKDQVDSISWLGIAINDLMEGPTKRDLEDEDYEYQQEQFREELQIGRSETTGY